MALSAYALFDLAEFKAHLGGVTGAAADTRIETLANQTAEDIEAFLGRQLVTRGDQTEYHTMAVNGHGLSSTELRTLEWPIVSVTNIWEAITWPRTYAAGELLTVDVDYLVSKPRGVVHRISSGGARCWLQDIRAIKITYKAGFASTATVPALIKEQALRYAALCYRETDRGHQGVSSMGDAAGNVTRFGPARLTVDMMEALSSERRWRAWETGERIA
jgi:hypothetical protein